MSPNGNDWINYKTVTKRKNEVDKLTPDMRYYFRVAALGAAGLESWSNTVSKIAA